MRPYTYITDDREVFTVCQEALWPEEFLGFDCETTGLDPTDIDTRLRLVTLATEKHAYIFDCFKLGWQGRKDLRAFFEEFEGAFVAHHAKFDAKFVMQNLGVRDFHDLRCTMLLAQLAACGEVDYEYSLHAVALRYLGEDLAKEQQTSDWNRPTLSERQLEYAGNDGRVLLRVYPKLWAAIEKQGQARVALIEFDCVQPLASLELNGLMLDRWMWAKVYDDVRTEWEALRHKLQDRLTVKRAQGALFEGVDPVNLNSPGQVIDALKPILRRKGLQIPIDRDTGRPTTRNYLMEPLAVMCEEVRMLLDYRDLQKAQSSYGLNYFDYINFFTGRIHPDVHQIGAWTGRMAMRNPNLQQPPKEDRYRRCFRAQDDWAIVAGDYSQFELRILADYSQDPDLLRAFREGLDLHTMSAQRIFQTEAPTTVQRDQAKNNNFASVYRAGPTRFALMAKIDYELAKAIMNNDRRAFPVKYNWIDSQAARAVMQGQIRTKADRLIKFDVPKGEDDESRRIRAEIERKGVNGPIQGTNADVTKRALGLLWKELSRRADIKLVHVVHDEGVLEAHKTVTREAEAILRSTFLTAGEEFVTSVPVKVDTRIGPAWAKGDD